ncbi:hypothetical protein V494_00979 [Pseudogymnoascus sp. VKM F-4513 (FW-928)]|nr:hypothetical protein V494_00979 [Pseudogymnoascus sp. VKM F-4513 (FW-928)]
MELDDFHPTDAEAWNYLVQHGHQVTSQAPAGVEQAFIAILKDKWEDDGIARINMHSFAIVWLDPTYKSLATRLAKGPTAEVFNIETIRELKKCRLEGSWDTLLENAASWLEMVFGESSSIPQEDFCRILECYNRAGHEVNLSDLFWDGGETDKAGTRREEFLSSLPFTEYKAAYRRVKEHPPDPNWDSMEIIKDIKEHGKFASTVMLHVVSWYDPGLTDPHSRTNIKPPIYKHLEKPFGEILPPYTDADTDGHWKTKALALQRIVIDFAKENGLKRKSKFMAATLVLKPPPGVYHKRFGKKTFWHRLARKIRHKMPEIPFQHPDLLPYNSRGSNIYDSRQRPPLGITSPAHPEGHDVPIVDLTVADRNLVSSEIEDLIGQEYGSGIPSLDELFFSERSPSTAAGNKQPSLASTTTPHLTLGVDDQQDLAEDDADTDYYESSLSITPPRSTRLRKRKTLHDITSESRRKSKIVKLKVHHSTSDSETAAAPGASASGAVKSVKNGRRDVHFSREQVERGGSGPPKSTSEPTSSTSVNDGQKSPIDSTRSSRRRRMVTNLPDDVFDTPASGVVESTLNRRESVRSPSRPPPLTAPPAPMFAVADEVVPPKPTEIPQADPTLSGVESTANREGSDHSMSPSIPDRATEILQAELPLSSGFKGAVQIILDEFANKLGVEKQIADIKEQVDTTNKQIIASQLDVEQQVTTIKEQTEADKLSIEGKVDGIQKQVDSINLNFTEQNAAIEKQINAMNEKVVAIAGDLDAMKGQVDATNKNVDADKLAIKGQVDEIQKQVFKLTTYANALNEQIIASRATREEQVDAINNKIVGITHSAGFLNRRVTATEDSTRSIKSQISDMRNHFDETKKQVDAYKLDIQGQINANKLDFQEQVNANKLDANKLDFQEQIDANKLDFQERVKAMEDYAATAVATTEEKAHDRSIQDKTARAVRIVGKLFNKLAKKDQVRAVNAVRKEGVLTVFLELSDELRIEWMGEELGLDMDKLMG